MPNPKLPPDKELVFLFQGRPEDRRSMRFDPPHSMSTDAQVLWAATRMGTIGQTFEWLGEDNESHLYTVVNKMEEPDAIIVLRERVGSTEAE